MAAAPRIYVDLDDVLSLTISRLADLLEQRHGRRVAIEDVQHFDLGRSFGLSHTELDDFMRVAHEPEQTARQRGGADNAGRPGKSCRGGDVAVVRFR